MRLVQSGLLPLLTIAVAAVSVVGGISLIGAGQPEYASAAFAAGITSMAWLMKAVADPTVPSVPSSVVMEILGGTQADGGNRFKFRVNAMLCLLAVFLLGALGAVLLRSVDAGALAYGLLLLAIGTAGTNMSDLVRPVDKDVPLPVVEALIARLAPADSADAA